MTYIAPGLQVGQQYTPQWTWTPGWPNGYWEQHNPWTPSDQSPGHDWRLPITQTIPHLTITTTPSLPSQIEPTSVSEALNEIDKANGIIKRMRAYIEKQREDLKIADELDALEENQ